MDVLITDEGIDRRFGTECRWAALEADDLAYHRGDVSFEDDHELELDLRLAGYELRRITGAQLESARRKSSALSATLSG